MVLIIKKDEANMKSKSNIKQKYIYILLKRNFLAMLILVLPMFLILFIGIIISEENILEHIRVSFEPIIIGIVGFTLSTLVIIRFNRLISYQEKMFNIKFDDKGAKRVRTSITFIAEDWLIYSGTCAFYREYIKSFGIKKEIHRRGAGPYTIVVNTIDGKKYYFKTPQTNDISLYRRWLHRKESK